ncbi:unnamed protein product [Kuraishia capsulata CBS 1993]|uniref:Uncharacterized protein n=1 Tax=Kuraishia capsulata CBS 1993 TaxID=1382522 RepID=W6MJV2_9ASCO|nr:uncharacterized protein KUCA_T00002244001 [Kuraishia capsulata CBS 1993]CDK26273.1 unnamed protein product [Kuraishia capsulata CBS 1993]
MTSIAISADDFGLLQGKVALVTGGGNGIGSALVELLASKGSKVVFVDLEEKQSSALAQRLSVKYGKGSVNFIRANVLDWQSLRASFEYAFELFGTIDLVIPVAGILETRDFLEMELDPVTGLLQEPSYLSFDINIKGVMNTVKLALHYFSKSPKKDVKRRLTLVDSTSGYFGGLGQLSYKASKHGVTGVLRTLVNYTEQYGFVINAIAPSYTETYMMGPLKETWAQQGGPKNTPEQVAAAIAQISVDPQAQGQCWLIVNGKLTEIEKKIQSLAPVWCGEENLAQLGKGKQILDFIGNYPLPKKREVFNDHENDAKL